MLKVALTLSCIFITSLNAMKTPLHSEVGDIVYLHIGQSEPALFQVVERESRGDSVIVRLNRPTDYVCGFPLNDEIIKRTYNRNQYNPNLWDFKEKYKGKYASVHGLGLMMLSGVSLGLTVLLIRHLISE